MKIESIILYILTCCPTSMVYHRLVSRILIFHSAGGGVCKHNRKKIKKKTNAEFFPLPHGFPSKY